MLTIIASLLIFHGAGCWEDSAGNYVLMNQTTKTSCVLVDHSLGNPGSAQAMTVIRRHMAGLPIPEALPPAPPEDPDAP